MADPATDMAATRPRAILFDWDKTLVDNWDAIVAALNEAFMAMDKPAMTPDEARLRIRKSARESFPDVFGARSDEALKIFYDAFARHHCTDLKPLNGVPDMLDALSSMGMRTGVVSNKTSDYLKKEIRHLGWDDYFDVVVGAGEAEFDKPHPAPIMLALQRGGLGQAGPDIWYIGDNEMDMICAGKAGLLPVLVNTMNLPMRHFKEAGAEPVLQFDDFESMLPLVSLWQRDGAAV